MSLKGSTRKGASTLRKRAEAAVTPYIPADLEQLQDEDVRRLVQDLHVHQVELHMQNEELREAQLELADSRDRYADLYDFAPVGYLTLRPDLSIEQANLRAATLLGAERQLLHGKLLTHFIAPEYQDMFYLHQQSVMKSGDTEKCELLLSPATGSARFVELKTVCVRDRATGDQELRCVLNDLTERKVNEAALQLSELRLSSLIQTIPDTVQFKDAEGRWLVANTQALRKFGLKDIEWQGRTDLELAAIIPAASEALKACALSDAEVRNSGVPLCHEKTFVAADGSIRHFEMIKVPLRETDGQISGLVVVGHDVTVRKQAEDEVRLLNDTLTEQVAEQTNALRLSEEKFRRIYEYAPTGIAIIDKEGKIVQCNPVYSRITGYSEEELREMLYSSLIHPEDRKRHQQMEQRLLKSQKAESVETEYRDMHKNGHTIWVHEVVSKLPYDSHLIILVNDISLRRQAEEELQRSETTLASFFESAPIGLVGLEHDGRILRVNQSQLKMFGHPRGAVLGHNIVEFDAGEELVGILSALERGEVVRDQRARLRRESGAIAHVLIDAIAIREEGRLQRMDLFIRNITRRIELEYQMLDVSERERQQVGRELHDDLGQILHGVHYIATELQSRMEAQGQVEAKSLAQITENIHRAMTTARNLARGLHPVPPVPEGLVSVLREHLARVRKLYGLSCRFICPEPIEVSDPEIATHLFRIAQEAVTNAVKHSKCTRITVRLKLGNGRILLGIQDDGNGRIERKGSTHGTGLRIMQSRSDAVDGSLIVQRGANGGTEVVCTLPYSPDANPLDEG
ncbi:MAG: PAS domain S-box protein [Opitutaceae bacterium]